MQARFIERDTRLDISFIKDGKPADLDYSGSFYNTEGDSIVMIEGEEFYDYCEKAFPGFRMEVTFFAKSMKYTFRAEYVGLIIINRIKLVRVEVKTAIEEVSRRSLPRIDLVMPARVCVTTESKMEFYYEAEINDVSLDAMSLFSTIRIPPGERAAAFGVGLTLGRNNFNLPCKLIREVPYDAHDKFNGKYIFALDFSANKEMKDKFLFALFDYRNGER